MLRFLKNIFAKKEAEREEVALDKLEGWFEGNTKDIFSVTITTSLLDNFKSHCEKKSINKSKLVEKWIQDFLEVER